MEYVAIVSARMESSRFPGKVMKEFWKNGTVLEILISRLKLSKRLNSIAIVTTPNERNSVIWDLCDRLGVYCFEGNEKESLVSVLNGIEKMRLITGDKISVIDITGDCPLIDPFQIDDMIEIFEKESYHYLSNCMVRSFPIGFDIQIYRDCLLYFVNSLVKNKNHRVHSGWNIWAYSSVLQEKYREELYGKNLKFGNICADEEYFFPNWRVVLDYKDDFLFLKNIINYFDRIDFSYQEIIDYIKENQELLTYNRHCVQKIPGVDQ